MLNAAPVRQLLFVLAMTIRRDTSLPSDQSDEQSSGTPNDPKTIQIDGRSLAGASYGANEREQTRDLRQTDPSSDGEVADGGVSEELNDDGRE
jgi:hypothetical protein